MNTRTQKSVSRKQSFREGKLKAKYTTQELITNYEQFENFSAQEEALLDAPILIFQMIEMVRDLKSCGIDCIFHFPGHQMMTRFFKQRFGGMGEVPKLIRNMERFKKLWGGIYNVFDKLFLDDLKLNFAAPTNNMGGCQLNHGVKISDGPLLWEDNTEHNKFNCYFGNVKMDTFNMVLVTMTGNHKFPLR